MKKIILLACTIILTSVSIFGSQPCTVKAATDTEDHGFKIDEKVFKVNWNETGKIKVKQTARSFDSAFDKGKVLGYAYVSAGFASSRYRVDGKYYQKILIKTEMIPQTVSGNKKGMSQYLKLSLDLGDLMKNAAIEPVSTSGSTGYSISYAIGRATSIGVGASTDKSIAINGSETQSEELTASVTFAKNSLRITTNKDDGGCATWVYDYVSSMVSEDQNAYLFGSSVQYSTYVWNMDKNCSDIYCGLNLGYTLTFGGGNQKTNEIIKNWTKTSNHLGSVSGDIYLVYK